MRTEPSPNKLKVVAAMLALGGMTVALLGMAYLFVTPKVYRAETRIKVEKRDWVHAQAVADARNPYDALLAPAECAVLRSNAFFDRVIQDLGLSRTWAKRYHQGTNLTRDDARGLLQMKAEISPLPRSSLFAITVTSEDRDETAKIANELARLYLDYRKAQHQELITNKVSALSQQWEEQNKKVMEAEARVTKIASNLKSVTYYDPESYRLLQGKRVQLENQIVQLNDQLTRFKSLPPSQLRQVLSTMDSSTNSVLNVSLLELGRARSDLITAESDHGADSPEVKRARLLVETLDGKVNDAVKSVMAGKETDLATLKAALDSWDEKLKHAKPVGEPDANVIQDPEYVQAVQELQKLQKDQQALLDKMDSADANEALMPVTVTAELMDSAEVPSQPFAPDIRIVWGTVGAGVVLVLGGMVLFVASQRQKPVSRKI